MKYPTTADDFIAYQERRFSEAMKTPGRQICELILPDVNRAYGDGLNGVETGLYPKNIEELFDHFEEMLLIDRQSSSDWTRAAVSACIVFCNEAWMQGQLDACKEVTA